MPGDSIKEKKKHFFNGIIWKPVDGQHVEHTCNILANNDLLCGSLSQANYDKIYLCRPTTIVLYDNKITSTILNDITIESKYYSTTGKMLEKLEYYRKVLADLMLKTITVKNSYVLCQALQA